LSPLHILRRGSKGAWRYHAGRLPPATASPASSLRERKPRAPRQAYVLSSQDRPPSISPHHRKHCQLSRIMSEPPRPRSNSPLLTSPEAAEYLRLSNRTLEGKRVDGTGPRYGKLGVGKRAKVVYRVADLDEWLANHQYTSTAEYKR